MAIGRDKTREKETPTVDLVTPHGAEVTVGAKRAKHLLARPAVRFPDGVQRKYAPLGESNVVADEPTAASAPRTGTRTNTGDDE